MRNLAAIIIAGATLLSGMPQALAQNCMYESCAGGTPPLMYGQPYDYQAPQPYYMPAPPPLPEVPAVRSYIRSCPRWWCRSGFSGLGP